MSLDDVDQPGHGIEGLLIRCGKYYAKVINGVCMECKQKVKITDET